MQTIAKVVVVVVLIGFIVVISGCKETSLIEEEREKVYFRVENVRLGSYAIPEGTRTEAAHSGICVDEFKKRLYPVKNDDFYCYIISVSPGDIECEDKSYISGEIYCGHCNAKNAYIDCYCNYLKE